MQIENLARKNILGISPYMAGKPIEETKREMGLREVIKLASNENPLGPSPKALSALKKCLRDLNRYPDSAGLSLKKRLAKHLGVSAANIVLGNGSDELIDIIIKAFVEEGQTILTSDVTFLEYEIVARILARRVITAPLKYFKYDLEAFKARIDKTTKVIFISNPNNPTGTYVTKQDFDNFILGLRQDLLVVLDEAYDAFIDVDDFPSGIKYLDKNVIVLKTFSKAYGLAGLRIGYAVADAGLASCMEKARQPFNTNSLAQSAATAALDDREFLRRSRRVILEGKAYLYDKLKVMAIPYVPSAANFILIDVGRDGAAVFREMLKFGVIVRDMKQYGLKNFIRVSVGTKKENQRFIRVLRKVIA